MSKTGNVEYHMEAAPESVFAAITDPSGLPRWNRRIAQVIDHPGRLTEGAEWVVQMKMYGQRFASRSRVLTLDPASGRFQHRSSPDGDPDYAIWTWDVSGEGTGSRVRVSWDLNPAQFLNRTFWVRLRSRALLKEVPASLGVLERLIAERSKRSEAVKAAST